MSTDDLSIQDPAALAWLERVQRPALIARSSNVASLIAASLPCRPFVRTLHAGPHDRPS